jgi:hypothetical protein
MKTDTISAPEKVEQLQMDLFELTGDVNFKKATNMGEVLQSALDFVVRNYKSENPYIIRKRRAKP